MAIRSLLKNTPFYGAYFVNRHAHRLSEWTTSDDRALNFYLPLVQPGDLVFDVGANIGERSKIFRMCGARVIAIEPQPLCVRVIKRAWDDVTVLQCAVSDTVRSDKLYLTSFHPHASMSADWKGGSRTIDIHTTTLNLLIECYGIPAFIKIDVEGHEIQVLRGLSQPIQLVSFEFHDDRLPDAMACFDRLQQLGDYEFNYCVEEEQSFQSGWVTRAAIEAGLFQKPPHYGDIYARLRAWSVDLIRERRTKL
jgi:FkbM family methyltransferase